MSRDLSLQVLQVTLEGSDQPQQALPLLFQVVDVGLPVVQVSLQTVQLLSHRRHTQDGTGRDKGRYLGKPGKEDTTPQASSHQHFS